MALMYQDKVVADVGGGGASSGVPFGVIAMWSGNADSIPPGWQLCDGTNGTPDLRDKFVLGAGGECAPGDTGGKKTVTLTVAQLPKHSHEFNWSPGGSGTNQYFKPVNAASYNTPAQTSKVGGDQPHNNMPPYYALCYIMHMEQGGGSGGSVSSGTAVKVMTPEEYRGLTVEEQQKDVLYVVSGALSEDITWWSPKMTSHTSPAPYVVSSSKEYTGNVTGLTAYSWHAFNGVIGDTIFDNNWYSTASARWIQIDFGNLDIIAGIRIYPSPLSNGVIAFPKTVTIKTSIDGTNWATVFIGAVPGYDPTVNFDPEEIDLPNVAARIVRIECGAGWNGINQTVINDIQFKRPTSGGKLYYKGKDVLSEGGSSETRNVYSEEETVIGTWIDGKPLYRLAIETTVANPGTASTIMELPAEAEVKMFQGFAKRVDSGTIYSLPNTEPNDLGHNIALYNHNGQIMVWAGSGVATRLKNGKFWAIAEYTKTTDEAQEEV